MSKFFKSKLAVVLFCSTFFILTCYLVNHNYYTVTQKIYYNDYPWISQKEKVQDFLDLVKTSTNGEIVFDFSANDFLHFAEKNGSVYAFITISSINNKLMEIKQITTPKVRNLSYSLLQRSEKPESFKQITRKEAFKYLNTLVKLSNYEKYKKEGPLPTNASEQEIREFLVISDTVFDRINSNNKCFVAYINWEVLGCPILLTLTQ